MTMPLAFFNLGPAELIVIGLIAILLFGRRLPEIGKNLGKTIVEFKKGLNSTGDEINKAVHEGEEPGTKNIYAGNLQQPAVKAGPTRQVKQIASTSEEP